MSDPRLHVAAVIISIHVLGQVGLGFRVSIPQILVSIGVCAVIEVAWTAIRSGELVWPASAMLTGSGVALIFRMLDTQTGDFWSFADWHVFALVAGGSLLTKYLIRYQGQPLFNPSNVGLVAAFLLLGSGRAEPLDFWWGPFDLWMALAYAVILAGGILVTARLGLLPMAIGFWVALITSVGVLSASGHCITARWAFEPVCGGHFWWIVATSPEVLVFMFFMITDPRTIPRGRAARMGFGVAVAVLSALLIAPQQNEFGAKVALLGALVVLTAVRPFVGRLFPEAGSASDSPIGAMRKWMPSPGRALMAAALVYAVGVGIVAAGAPAREPANRADITVEIPEVEVDMTLLPEATVDPEVAELDAGVASRAQEVLEGLALALATENQAVAAGDRSLLTAADTGPRLVEMGRIVDEAGDTIILSNYMFRSAHVVVTHPYGPQGGAAPGVEATGTLVQVTYGGSGEEGTSSESEFAIRFAMQRLSSGRWRIVSATPIG